jgi:hypothetical protein
MNINLKDEELLQQYFEHDMSGGEEQNFLIDVAARDDMRLAFRSQLELLKAVGKDKMAMPAAAFVRERTLAALGLSAMLLAPQEEAKAAPSLMSRTFDVLRKPVVSLSLGLLIGGAGVYGILPGSHVEQKVIAPKQEISTPLTTEPTKQNAMPEAISTNERAAVKHVVSAKALQTVATSPNADPSQKPLPIVDTKKAGKGSIIEPTFKKPTDTNSK